MPRGSAALAALLLPLTLAACSAVPDPRCAERAPEVSPDPPRLMPPGWPAPPTGDTVCGSDLVGDESGGLEVAIVVTDREMAQVLAHYADRLPPELPIAPVPGSDRPALSGAVPGLVYAVEASGPGRYALVFHVLSGG